MREKLRDKDRLNHILESINNVFEFTQNVTLKEYQQNKMLKFAVIKNLEIIGEAAYLLTNDFKELNDHINWKDIVGMRHVLVHGYYQIKDEIIWATIESDLEKLKNDIKNLISQF